MAKKLAENEEREAPEVAPELSAMSGEAAALDADVFGDVGPAPDVAGPVAAVDPAAEVRDLIGLVVGLLSPALPYLPTIYTPEKIDTLAGAYVPVAEKYGWNVGGVLSEYGAEIALAAVAVPLAVQTRIAHQGWREQCALVEMRRRADAEAHFRGTRGLDDGPGPEQAAPVGSPGDGTLREGSPGARDDG